MPSGIYTDWNYFIFLEVILKKKDFKNKHSILKLVVIIVYYNFLIYDLRNMKTKLGKYLYLVL